MLGAVLGLGEALGARFRVLGLLPTALLASFVIALLKSGAPGQAPDLDKVSSAVEGLDAWGGILLLLGIIAVALIAEPLQLSLVRLLEGYWAASTFGAALSRLLVKLQGRRRSNEQEIERRPAGEVSDARRTLAGWRLRHLYPPEGVELLPTRLGNVLRVAEDRAGRRYGLDAVVVWARLYPLLPDHLVAILDDQRTQMDVAARFCVVFAGAAIVSASLLASHGPWLAVAAGAIVLAAVSYRSAVAAGIAYGETLEVAFDLHRFDLLTGLHLSLPANRSAERAANKELSRFLRQGKPVNFRYDHAEAKNADTTAVGVAIDSGGAVRATTASSNQEVQAKRSGGE
jgi:hypothetical protein